VNRCFCVDLGLTEEGLSRFAFLSTVNFFIIIAYLQRDSRKRN
jgi:hypothetical protein